MKNYLLTFLFYLLFSSIAKCSTSTTSAIDSFNCTKSINLSTLGTAVSIAYNPINHYLAIALINSIDLYNLEKDEWVGTTIDTTA